MKHPKSIDRTYAQRCLDDLSIAQMCAIDMSYFKAVTAQF